MARFFGFGQGEKGLKAGSCGVYRILLVALFFCFLGTMLGGIWADMSWGRFWGWDPKENGALMTLLWCSCTLHARLLHVCSCQGFLVLASLGNIVAAWGWFGVNLMGIGLHSYGFVEGGWFWFSFCGPSGPCGSFSPDSPKEPLMILRTIGQGRGGVRDIRH